MSKWIPLMMVAALTLFTGCKKSGQPKTEAPAVDTAAALPAPPELEPVDADLFADSMPAAKVDSVATKKTTTPAAPAVKPVPTPASAPAAAPATKPAATIAAKPASKVAPATTKSATTVTAGTSDKGAYTLQVGIFNTEKQANATSDKLKAQGFPAYVTRVQDPKPTMPGTYYRVRVGSFATSEAARAYGQANLAPAGVDFWADLKGHDSKSLPSQASSAAAQPVVKAKPAPVATPTPAPAAAPKPAPTQSAPASSTPAPAASTPAPATQSAPASTPAPAAAPAPATQDTKPARTLPDW
ncbi:MAG TPA: SPOR domain-containing protein [Fibrobacteria bacterium]|nr:SPOR domain-containing protein [Fibrobacteria bacterium]